VPQARSAELRAANMPVTGAPVAALPANGKISDSYRGGRLFKKRNVQKESHDRRAAVFDPANHGSSYSDLLCHEIEELHPRADVA